MSSYNKASFIAEAINSVINQSYLDWELIIIDDDSKDHSKEIIESIATKHNKIKPFYNSENKGANYSRNFALSKAIGDFIIFLDADDLLINDCLQNRVKEMNANSKYDFCVFTMGSFKFKIGDDHRIWKPNSRNSLNDFLYHYLPWAIPQPIWKKEFLKSLGGFNEEYRRMQDVELHTRALLKNGVLFNQVVDEPDCYYRIDEDRNDLEVFQFWLRRVEHTIKYVNNFQYLPVKNKKYLIGTIYETFVQIVLQFKIKNISEEDYFKLQKKLIHKSNFMNGSQIFIFSLSKFYNLNMPRIPGINKAIKKTLVLFSIF
ncbi:MAG: glycosyltransferase family 2 protein [Bacteroidota bacterium]